ncbi:MAG: hypothetical protein WCK49_03035 [Myxococcaceae bacterium]
MGKLTLFLIFSTGLFATTLPEERILKAQRVSFQGKPSYEPSRNSGPQAFVRSLVLRGQPHHEHEFYKVLQYCVDSSEVSNFNLMIDVVLGGMGLGGFFMSMSTEGHLRGLYLTVSVASTFALIVHSDYFMPKTDKIALNPRSLIQCYNYYYRDYDRSELQGAEHFETAISYIDANLDILLPVVSLVTNSNSQFDYAVIVGHNKTDKTFKILWSNGQLEECSHESLERRMSIILDSTHKFQTLQRFNWINFSNK